MTVPAVVVCALAEIADGQARGFSVGEGPARREVLVARRGMAVFAYDNRCPHRGTPLDWAPDRFMSLDGQHLQCATHGARFRVEDGMCVAGPCRGVPLTSLGAVVRAGTVVLHLR